MNKTFNQFTGGSDIVVIGTDPERADYDNPRGQIFGFAAYVRAANEFGDTRVIRLKTFRGEREATAYAEEYAARLQNRLDTLGKLPVGFEAWEEGRAVYGSDAYVAYGQAEEVEWEARMAEEEAWA